MPEAIVRFGAIPTDEALGAVAGHTLRLGEAGVIKKGSLLTERHLAALRAAGHAEVVAARLDADDVREDAAALRVARALAGPGVRLAEAATGRCNLHARAAGLLSLDRERIDRLNLIDEAVTVATLAPHTPVREGDMVATVKIIPYAVRTEVLHACEAAVGPAGSAALRVLPFARLRVGLVLTRLPGVSESVLERAASAQRTRVERTGGTLAGERRCPHDEAEVAAAIVELRAAGCAPIWVLGASAIADRRDVIPAAIERAGGLIEHLGMPVDPGNLLLLGRLGDTAILGVPGCARSLKRSGFDLVIERLAAGLPVARADLMTMGVGGLLSEIDSRGQPRQALAPAPTDDGDGDGDGDRRPVAPAARLAAVVLAAGHSRRMGEHNKLLLPVDDKPMVAHVVDALVAAGVAPIVVVTGHQSEAVRAALGDRPVEFVHNPDHPQGMGTSLRAGALALRARAALAQPPFSGLLVCLADMPRLRAHHLARLREAFAPAAGRDICVPTFERKRGNPVLFGTGYLDELALLEGDVGARELLSRHADRLALVPMADEGVLLDVDTPDALRALADRGAQGG